MNAPTAVIAALPEEIAPLLRRAGARRRGRRPRWWAGRLAGVPLAIAASGDGERAAAAGLAALLSVSGARRAVAIGVAGGLSRDLAAGDLVLAVEVRGPAGPAPAPDAVWLAAAVAGSAASPGVVVSAGRILATVEEKAELLERVRQQGAFSGPVAVDLESAAFAGAAAERGVPFLVARAVSDTAGEALPLDFERFRGADGVTRRLAVVLHVLPRPALWSELAALRRRVRLCAERLAELVEEVVAA